MTKAAQKKIERFFVEQAIESIGVSWSIVEERDPPDFIIPDGDHRFGLNVVEVFGGARDHQGSVTKCAESDTQKRLNDLRRPYETETGVVLSVKFLGRIAPDTLAEVLPRLLALDLGSKPLAFGIDFEIQVGFDAPLKLFVRKHVRSEWITVNDRVGFSTPDPDTVIAVEIENKSRKLAQYKLIAGEDTGGRSPISSAPTARGARRSTRRPRRSANRSEPRGRCSRRAGSRVCAGINVGKPSLLFAVARSGAGRC